MFWVAVICAMADIVLASITFSIPELSRVTLVFLFSAALFVLGAACSYFDLSKDKTNTK